MGVEAEGSGEIPVLEPASEQPDAPTPGALMTQFAGPIPSQLADAVKGQFAGAVTRLPQLLRRPAESRYGPAKEQQAGAQTQGVLPKERYAPELAEAKKAVERFAPPGGPDQLQHGEYDYSTVGAASRAKAEQNAEQLLPLSPQALKEVVRALPYEIGNAPGVTGKLRDKANRIAMSNDFKALRGVLPDEKPTEWMHTFLTPAERQLFSNIVRAANHLQKIEREAESLPDKPAVQVLAYDPAAFGGQGRIVVSIGEVDAVSSNGAGDSFSWHVGGMGTSMQSLLWKSHFGMNQYDVTSRYAFPGLRHGSIIWIGYQHPSGPLAAIKNTRSTYAEAGGLLLARDIAEFNATREIYAPEGPGTARPLNHVYGHSYGFTTVSCAAAEGRLANEIHTVISSGAAGAGPVKHASEYGVAEMYAARAAGDLVTYLGADNNESDGRIFGKGLGMDPASDDFGAIRIAADFPELPISNMPLKWHQNNPAYIRHQGYFMFMDAERRVPSPSLESFGLISAGLGHHARRHEAPPVILRG